MLEASLDNKICATSLNRRRCTCIVAWISKFGTKRLADADHFQLARTTV